MVLNKKFKNPGESSTPGLPPSIRHWVQLTVKQPLNKLHRY